MAGGSQPRIGLFALTGMGNAVLRALARVGTRPVLVVTRAEAGSFPYYPEQPLVQSAADHGIDCLIGEEGERHAATEGLDVILIATYHRILKPALLATAKHAINLHPSLLPRYRGANPFFWVIRNGEHETGLTAHGVTAEVDAGPIHWQRIIPIDTDETQGTLRRRLADLAAEAAVDVVMAIRADKLERRPQQADLASSYERPSENDRLVDLSRDLETTARWVRALSPFPGALVEGRKVSGVVGLSEMPVAHPGATTVTESAGTLRIERDRQVLTLRLAD